jgi:hypothetical protein
MKRVIRAVIAALCLFLPLVASAQTIAPSNLVYVWPTVSTTGQLGNYLAFGADPSANLPIPANYSIAWSISGTAPTACTFRVEGSIDGINWFGLDTTYPASTSCLTAGAESIAFKPFPYMRINVPTYTQGDGTTAVVFRFAGKR